MSDRLRRNWPPSFLSEFRALQFSLMLCAFIGALGGAAFLGTAIFIEGDRRRAQLHVQGQWGLLPSFRMLPACSFARVSSPVNWRLLAHRPPSCCFGSAWQQDGVLLCPQLWGPIRFPPPVCPSQALCLSALQPWL